VDPLHAKSELEEEGTQQEREQVPSRSVGERIHDQPKRVAKEHPERVRERLDIETDYLGQRLDLPTDEVRD